MEAPRCRTLGRIRRPKKKFPVYRVLRCQKQASGAARALESFIAVLIVVQEGLNSSPTLSPVLAAMRTTGPRHPDSALSV